jgi:GrpB-like predicted nucleotidyltransferase (UPF0157 family)
MAVQISDYDPAWPQKFAEQRDQLAISLKPWLFKPIEHVGATAVVGLPAKPIIDIAAPVISLQQAHNALPVLEQAGWRHWSSDPDRSWRLWFLYPRPEARTHHLYLIEHDDPHLRELIAFRDQLRADAPSRERYAELKQLLAQTYRNDREAYTAAKADFVTRLLRQTGIEMLPHAVNGPAPQNVELIGAVEKRVIEIAPPDPRWPAKFTFEREKIMKSLGDRAIRIDHIGSTSIPGLAAKPVIDIDLSVHNVDREAEYLPHLLDAGYQLRVRESGHRMVRTPNLGVQVHVCSTGSEWERRHLLFRDWLRYDSSDRDAYSALKIQLAQQDWSDMNAYAQAKGPLISDIITRAEKWASETGWTVSGTSGTSQSTNGDG